MSLDPRLAAWEDLTGVEATVAAAYAPWVARIGRPPAPMLADYASLISEGRVHVLDHGGAVRGMVVLIAEPHAMLLDSLAVAPAAQRQGLGLGRRLLAFAEQESLRAGLPCIRLYANEAMTRNISLYARTGYIETHRAVEDGLRRVYMTKAL